MQLKDYFNVIRKRWWLVIITVIAAATVAFVYSSLQPKTYQSTVQLIGDIGKKGDLGLYGGLKQQLQGYGPLFTSTDLGNQISQRAQLDLPPQTVLNEIHVQAQPDQLIFVITVSDTSAENAKKIADAAADILVEKNLADTEGLNPDQLIIISKNSPASLPDRPSTPRTGLLTGAGAGLGLVLGVILMFIIEFLDDTIKDESDVTRYAGLNLLGQLPRWKPGNTALKKTAIPPDLSQQQERVVQVQNEAAKVKTK